MGSLDKYANKRGFWTENGEGDPTDILAIEERNPTEED